jgi:hypothetical protein
MYEFIDPIMVSTDVMILLHITLHKVRAEVAEMLSSGFIPLRSRIFLG